MRWVKEFGEEYDIPKWITDRFEDHSCHDDAMPMFWWHPTGDAWDDEQGDMKPDAIGLQVEHPEMERREGYDGVIEECHRFYAYRHGDNQELFSTESEAEFRQWCEDNLRIEAS